MDPAPATEPVLWKPSRTDGIWIYVVAVTLALVIIGLGLLFTTRDLNLFDAPPDLTGNDVGLFLTGAVVSLALVVGFAVAHEGLHAVGYLILGGRPKLVFGVLPAVGPSFWCSSPGQKLTVAQYVTVYLAPTLLINSALLAGLWTGAGWVFVLPLAVHIAGGCVEDWVYVARALKAPAGSLIENIKGGLVIHNPGPGIR